MNHLICDRGLNSLVGELHDVKVGVKEKEFCSSFGIYLLG